MAHDVFVSHSAKDKTISNALVARLEAEGIRCWVAPRDVVPGADWGESIIDAIESSRIMVLIFSASANGSPQIKREIERAVDKGVYTIPFRIEDVQPTKALEYFISSAHWLDAFSQPLGEHLDSLAKTLNAILATPRPGSTAETAPPVPRQHDRVSAAPPPPPVLAPHENQSRFSPEPATPPPPRKTMWTPVIVGTLAFLLIVGVVVAGALVYLFRAPSTPPQVSSSPTPTTASPPQTSPTVTRKKDSPSSLIPTSPVPSDTEPESPAAEDSDSVPSDEEVKKLVLDTLLLFNDAVQTRSFKAFHAKLATSWKKNTTPEALMNSFREFLENNVDIAEIADVDPSFDEVPAIKEFGWLEAKGEYGLEDRDVHFECKYEKEQSNWKLASIGVEATAARR
jgi:hypothetical protein